MFGDLWMRLGKFVQRALNRFRKRKPQYEMAEGNWTVLGKPIDIKFSTLSNSSDSLLGKEVKLKDGEIFIGDTSLGKVGEIKSIPLFETTDSPAKLLRDLNWDAPVVFTGELEPETAKMLENLANTYKPVLPKRIAVPTLLVTVCTNWDYDSMGVDLSQLEEKGIAHYFCTSTKSMEEWHADLYGDEEECIYDDMETICLRDATLYEWEDGHWTWSF